MHSCVSILVPLYRSKKFVPNIIANISSTTYPNLEIIISDRHLEDSALEDLRLKFDSDSRVRFLAAQDRLNWVEHFNLLLKESSGEFFLWMPHDDSYSENFIDLLVQALEADSNAIIAFGKILAVDQQKRILEWPLFSDPPLDSNQEWSLQTILSLLGTWSLGVPFRGVFRRSIVLNNNLLMLQTFQNTHADLYWVFALGLHGSFKYLPNCICYKSYYSESTHAAWKEDFRHAWSAIKTLRAYFKRSKAAVSEKILANIVFILWMCRVALNGKKRAIPDFIRLLPERLLCRLIAFKSY